MVEGCTCQGCGKVYRVDILIPKVLWEEIKPIGKPRGAGLLCGVCICERIEKLNEFRAFVLIDYVSTPCKPLN